MVFGDVTRHLVLRRGAADTELGPATRSRHLAVVARRDSVDVGVVPALETAQACEAEQAEEPQRPVLSLSLWLVLLVSFRATTDCVAAGAAAVLALATPAPAEGDADAVRTTARV